MTDECRPDEGAEPGSLHWLDHYPTLNRIVQEWEGDAWKFGEMSHSPSVVASWAYRYHAPADPDDAAERKRLADENLRLLEALQTIADGEFDCAPGQRFIAAQELARETIGNGSAS